MHDSYIILSRMVTPEGKETDEKWAVVDNMPLAERYGRELLGKGWVVSIYAGFLAAPRMVPEGVSV